MADATDSNLPVSKVTISTPDAVQNVDPLDGSTADMGRTNQQQVLPSAIQTRLIGNLFSNNPSSDALGSGIQGNAVVTNSTSTSFIFTLTDNQGRELIAVPDIAFYVGNQISSTTAWPNQSFGMGNMPIAIYNDWSLTNNKNVVTRAIIRNNSGADQNVFCVCRFRIIANPSTTLGA